MAWVVAAARAISAVRYFRLNSDVNAVLPTNDARKRREITFGSALQRLDFLEALVEAPTPELAASATSEPAHALETDNGRFASVADVSASSFFQRLIEGILTKIPFLAPLQR